MGPSASGRRWAREEGGCLTRKLIPLRETELWCQAPPKPGLLAPHCRGWGRASGGGQAKLTLMAQLLGAEGSTQGKATLVPTQRHSQGFSRA